MLHLYNCHESLNISSWWGLGLSLLVHADMLKPAQECMGDLLDSAGGGPIYGGLTVEWPDVANKSIGCPVKFEHQVKDKVFSMDVPNILSGITTWRKRTVRKLN